ncbi:MAG TPA: NAD(+)/NADH kinase [Gaiellaceae bacterium]|nr:NAD(+)/NADH kinase [Gaiellaceae bacterium]
MTSTTGSTPKSADAVRRAAVFLHGERDLVATAYDRLREVARRSDVELVEGDEPPDLAVVLGGDGTMIRALRRYLGTDVPVLGVNFGRVGFLTSIMADDLENGLARAFAGDYAVADLPTLDARVDGASHVAVNDLVVHASSLGRMVELGWEVGGEDYGATACDGVVCSAPSGSTAYNLSNGGPVLAWGLDAMAITFIAPHSLRVRPLVIGRNAEAVIRNRTADVLATVLVDGHAAAEIGPGPEVHVRLGEQRTRLAMLPDSVFFRRYRETFAS